LGATPSTTNVVKLRCSTVPAASSSQSASTATAGSAGICTESGARASDCQARAATFRDPVLQVERSPSVFHP
jgi:hypothetical protein